jgi:hypothetical protein
MDRKGVAVILIARIAIALLAVGIMLTLVLKAMEVI